MSGRWGNNYGRGVRGVAGVCWVVLPSARVVSVLCCQDISGASITEGRSGLELGAVRVQGPLTHRVHELAWRVGSTGMAKTGELRQPRGRAVGAGDGGGRMGTGAQVAGRHLGCLTSQVICKAMRPSLPGALQSSTPSS